MKQYFDLHQFTSLTESS